MGEQDMSDETVVVPVKLPKPPEGKAWEMTGPTLNNERTAAGVYFEQVPVAPPERMVPVMLRESDAHSIAERYWYAELRDRAEETARKALAQQQEVCGEPIHQALSGDWVTCHTGDCGKCHITPKGHAGAHAP